MDLLPSVIGSDIATKETLALNNALQSFGNTVRNSWVDAFVDSQVLLHSWNRRGSRSPCSPGRNPTSFLVVFAFVCILFQLLVSFQRDKWHSSHPLQEWSFGRQADPMGPLGFPVYKSLDEQCLLLYKGN